MYVYECTPVCIHVYMCVGGVSLQMYVNMCRPVADWASSSRARHRCTESGSLTWTQSWPAYSGNALTVFPECLNHDMHAAFYMGTGDLISNLNTDMARASLTEPTPSLLTVPIYPMLF